MRFGKYLGILAVPNEIRGINNGNIFNEDDWKRVITIAEGNTNIDVVGQLGVGFFSVFSYSEKPMIQSDVSMKLSSKSQDFFHVKLFIQTEQIFNIMNGSSITLNHIDVESDVHINEDIHEKYFIIS
ncbi:unnamed protein product [Adineta steineri]|uniref:Uncharacterized protein n=2 Tax=Adineta steineri TaxID=433720 RepID=A0A814JLI2_9BILA|nr:unnamed protein product [Adineta steineri]